MMRQLKSKVMIIVVMGVSGCGKTTIGELLATRVNGCFADADNFHSAANKQKMHAGIALQDTDRWPWLHAIRAWMEAAMAEGANAVVACSALKQVYRNILSGLPSNHRLKSNGDGQVDHSGNSALGSDVRYVYLRGTYALLKDRIEHRKDHFFDPALLRSQLDTLEEPTGSNVLTVDIGAAPDQLVEQIVQAMRLANTAALPR